MLTAEFPWASSATVIVPFGSKIDPGTMSMDPWKHGLAVFHRRYAVL